ncbi:MAG: hypothetical protein ACI4KM_02945 [Oscillospiraceae bacterium]
MKRIILLAVGCSLLTACSQTNSPVQTSEAQPAEIVLRCFDEDSVKEQLITNPDNAEGILLKVDAGAITFVNNREDDVAAMVAETYYDMQTNERYREHFKFREIDGVSSEHALAEAQNVIDNLGITNVEEPLIFTCPGHTYNFSESDIVDIKDSYYILYLADDSKPYYEGNRGYAEFIIYEKGIASFHTNYIIE